MKRRVEWLAILAIIAGCSSPTGPSVSFILMDYRFEDQEELLLEGWHDEYTRTSSLSLTNDTAPDGGQWALKAFEQNSSSRLSFGFKPIAPTRNMRFRFTYRLKTSPAYPIYNVHFEVYRAGEMIFMHPTGRISSEWFQDTLTYLAETFSPDSMVVALNMMGQNQFADPSKHVILDNFKVEQYLQ